MSLEGLRFLRSPAHLPEVGERGLWLSSNVVYTKDTDLRVSDYAGETTDLRLIYGFMGGSVATLGKSAPFVDALFRGDISGFIDHGEMCPVT